MGDSSTHLLFTRALLKEHKYEEAAQFMKTRMAKTSVCRQNHIWDSLIQGLCIDVKDPEKALSVLKDCLRVDGILPSSFTFCSLIHCLSSMGMMDRTIEVLELMTDEKIQYPFDNFVTSSVISGFVKIGKPEVAIGFYENAEKAGGLRPNIVTGTALVSAYCRLGRIEEARDLVSMMENEGVAFDVVFYSNWMYEYFREGFLVMAFQKYKEMGERKIDLDTISYTILIDGFSKEGNVEKTVGFLNKMRKDGLKPNLVTYTAVMLGFCKKGKIEEAITVLKTVENLGIELDEFAYATLIDGICRKGNFPIVFQLLAEMEKKGIKPSIVTYNTVIKGLCKAGRTSEANEISKGIVGDVVTYGTLLTGYIEEENVTGMLEIKKRLEADGVCLDVVMCNILIKALFMVGSFEDALAIYKGMPDMDLAADSVTYCTMIDGYCKAGRIDEALEKFDEFRKASIYSVACYNCILHGLCKKRMVGMAIEVFLELNERGLPVDVDIYMMLIKAIFEEKGAEGVLHLVHRIENLGYDIFDTLCDSAISFLCKRGFPEAASDVYMVLRRKGSVVTGRSYYSLLEALVHDSKNGLTQPILGSFVKKYGPFESRVREILVYCLCMDNVNKALRFLTKMKENMCNVAFPVTVIEKLTKNGRVLDAYELVMGANGHLPPMDVVDYSIVVDSLCKSGHFHKALDVCDFARRTGVMLNIVTYNSVINGLCRQGCLVEALRLFDSLEKINTVPSEITYATLIDTLSKGGFLLDARNMFESMVLKDFKPNTRVYNSLINGYCKLGQMQEALKLLHDLEVKCLQPDGFTVSTMIDGYCLKGDMEGALGFFFEFKRKGMPPDLLGFIYLMRGLCAKGRMEESRSILREMLQTQHVVDVLNEVDTQVEMESLASFLVSLCEQGSIQEAITILNEVASMFFHVGRRSGACNGSEILEEPYNGKTFDVVKSKSLICNYETDLDFKSCNMGRLEEFMKKDPTVDGAPFHSTCNIKPRRLHLQVVDSDNCKNKADDLGRCFFLVYTAMLYHCHPLLHCLCAILRYSCQ
ncbi:unnamed protein product [Ilex paraguariensis]|uniref:Pentatricopeptide repeat-containing protein n=1 Tax=Ilex paraguariensis TaxID=185542 RepID=A0ABC8UMV7_9AQUA